MNTFLYALLQRRVFANALMGIFLVGGLLSAATIRQELMPDQKERRVEVSVELPGASPEEIETAILVPLENAVGGLDQIKRIDAEAREGIGVVTVTLLEGAELQQVLGDIKQAVDRIPTLPQDAEVPAVTVPAVTEKALSIVVYGDQPLLWLQQTAEAVRDDLRIRVGLTKVALAFPREPEIAIEIATDTLRRYGLSLEDVAAQIRENALDMAGGTLFDPRSDIALRTAERREWADGFAGIVVARTSAGIPVRLSDIASLQDSFGPSAIETWFNGQPAVQIDVFAVGDETPISVGAAVRGYLDTFARQRYPGVGMVVFENEAEAYHRRMALLIDNALAGLVLVLVTLGLFLTPQLAFWVMMGIPTALLGGLLLLPLFDASVNMISLFAFIVTIGVVVDDAIMMGEAIFVQRAKGLDPLRAAVKGLQEMGGPILLATSTTMIAFMPLFFVPGAMGDVFRQIPAVMVAVLSVSLVESMFILAAHLARDRPERAWLRWLARPQRAINARLERFIQGAFRRLIQACLNRPAVLFAAAMSLLLVTSGGIGGGLLGFDFVPTIESDTVIAQATLPYGTPRQQSIAVQQALVETAERVLQDHRMASPGIFSLIGTRLEEGEVEVETLTGSHYISVLMALPPQEGRTLPGRAFARAWQDAFGDPGELEALHFTGETKVTGGEPLRLEVFHPDGAVAREAALRLGERLRNCPGLTSVDDGIRYGKPELKLTLKAGGLLLGLTAQDVATQVRHRYYGAEALRLVRDGNEVKVMVRLTEKERQQRSTLEAILLKSPSGHLVPLTQVADITPTRSFTGLARRSGKRIYPVSADISIGIDDDAVEEALEKEILPVIAAEFPGVSVGLGGEQEEVDEVLTALGKGFLIVLGALYLLLGLHYNSYIQPLLVLAVVPFSLIGAVWGHILLGYDLSIVSMLGIIVTSGVVVNDSLVLVTTYNRHRGQGADHRGAIVEAACQRFRPILLTSLTTCCGLLPLLLERSEQAQFLIPAVVSISFGLACGTGITLVLMPALLWVCRTRGEAC